MADEFRKASDATKRAADALLRVAEGKREAALKKGDSSGENAELAKRTWRRGA